MLSLVTHALQQMHLPCPFSFVLNKSYKWKNSKVSIFTHQTYSITANMIEGKENSHAHSNESCQVGNRIVLNYIEDVASHSPDKPVFCQLVESKNSDHDQSQNIIVSYRDLVNLINKICWLLKSIDVEPKSSNVFAYGLNLT